MAPYSRITRPTRRFVSLLESAESPVVSYRDMFLLLRRLHAEAAEYRLRLPARGATAEELLRRHAVLRRERIVRADDDYPGRWRVLTVPDLGADEIACLTDRFCHISHLSAMQLWHLTDRSPASLILSRPDRPAVNALIAETMMREGADEFPLRGVIHPEIVRGHPVRVVERRRAGRSVVVRNGFARVSTIGQTFLDMLDRPELCGGMSHVIDVWRGHARVYLDDIVSSVDGGSGIVRCRAGHILEERLAVHDRRIERWRDSAQRGGSRRLDPKLPFAPRFSERWMLSLNVP